MAAACSAAAKDKMIPLAEADASALKDKTIALTVHERPTFVAMTAGKVTFGLLGVAAMASAGNKLVDENHIADPAEILRTNLAAGLQNAYGAKLLPADTTVTKAKKPQEIASTHPEADYVLDVRSAGWNYAYYPARWGSYWVGYSVQVQLLDAKTGRQVSNMACTANTHENPKAPSREQLNANGAQLLKDVTAGLGWTCVQLLAKEQFHLAPEQVAATPAEYVNPLASITDATPAGAAPAAPTAPAQGDANDPVVEASAPPAPAAADGAH